MRKGAAVTCERAWEVDAAADGRLSPTDPALREHWSACALCRDRAAAHHRLRSVLQALPPFVPDEPSLRRVRSRVLRDASMAFLPPPPSHRRAFGLAAGGLLVAAVAAAALLRARSAAAPGPLPPESGAAAIVASPGASASGGPGWSSVPSPSPVATEATEPAESADRKSSPPTTHGPNAVEPRVAASKRGTAGEPDVDNDDYATAVALFSAGRYASAVEALHRVVSSRPDASTSEDALFLEALSLARLGRAQDAARVAAQHQVRYPQSVHRKDAALLVARAAHARGDCDGAKAALAPWLDAGDDSARREMAGCER